MTTTTIRVGLETRAVLLALSSAAGTTLIETARQAAEARRRQRFGSQVSAELAALSADPDAYEDYLGDTAPTDVSDGIR